MYLVMRKNLESGEKVPCRMFETLEDARMYCAVRETFYSITENDYRFTIWCCDRFNENFDFLGVY